MKKKQIFGQRSTITLLVFIIESINPVVHLKILEYIWSKYNKKTEIVIGKHFFIFFSFSFSLILFCLFGFLILRDRKKGCEVGGDGKCLGGVWEGDTVIKIYFMIFFQ